MTPAGALDLAVRLIDFNENGPGGPRLKPYRDSRGIPTIGTGCTRIDGKPVTMQTPPITHAKADEMLAFELGQTDKLLVSVIKIQISANQWAALASFAFNVGGAAFTGSTLLRRLNANLTQLAAEQFLAWDKETVGGVLRVSTGLLNRRQRERALFLGLPVVEIHYEGELIS